MTDNKELICSAIKSLALPDYIKILKLKDESARIGIFSLPSFSVGTVKLSKAWYDNNLNFSFYSAIDPDLKIMEIKYTDILCFLYCDEAQFVNFYSKRKILALIYKYSQRSYTFNREKLTYERNRNQRNYFCRSMFYKAISEYKKREN